MVIAVFICPPFTDQPERFMVAEEDAPHVNISMDMTWSSYFEVQVKFQALTGVNLALLKPSTAR